MKQVYEGFPGYCDWAMDQPSPSASLIKLREYIEKRREEEEEERESRSAKRLLRPPVSPPTTPTRNAAGSPAGGYVRRSIKCWKCKEHTPVYSWPGHVWMQASMHHALMCSSLAQYST